MSAGTNVNVPLFSSGAMFTPPEVTTVSSNNPMMPPPSNVVSQMSVQAEPVVQTVAEPAQEKVMEPAQQMVAEANAQPVTEQEPVVRKAPQMNAQPVTEANAQPMAQADAQVMSEGDAQVMSKGDAQPMSEADAQVLDDSSSTNVQQMGGNAASAALMGMPEPTDPFWRQALLDACREVRVEKAYNDTFLNSGSSGAISLPVLPNTNPLYPLTQTNPPGVTASMLASLGFSMPPNLAASAASPIVLTRAVNAQLYDMIVTSPNPALWEPILKGYNPPMLFPTDLPLASGAVAPLAGKEKWKEDNRSLYSITDATDDQIILRDGMTADQTAAVIFNFNIRQYIKPKAEALGAAERTWRIANNYATYDRVGWVTRNIPIADMIIFDRSNAGLYSPSRTVTLVDILQRIVLMESRLLGGAGFVPSTPVAPTPGALTPGTVTSVGIPNPSAMTAPILAAIQSISAPNSPLVTLVKQVGSAVTKVGKQLTTTSTTVTEIKTGVDAISAAVSSNNGQGGGGGRKSRRIRRA
jgi:hypothetical protein